MFNFKPVPVPAWELKLLTAAQFIEPIRARPSLEGAAQRLALRGFDIMREAQDSAARSQLEISGAYRRRR